MPMNRSGRSVTEASLVIEIDDVFVAKIAVRLQGRAELGKNLAFDLLVLGRGFDDEVAIAEGVEVERGRDPVQSRVACRRLELFAFDLAREIACDGGKTGIDARFRDIVEGDIDAGQRADLGDARAHLAGPDHPILFMSISCRP